MEAQDGDTSAQNASLRAALPIYHLSWEPPRYATGKHVLFCGYASTGTEKQPRDRILLGGTRVFRQSDCQAVPEVRCANSLNELRWVDSL